jgi:hypothetical protein
VHVVVEGQVPDAITAVGARLLAGSVIVTSWLTDAAFPQTSVAVSVTVYVPGVLKVLEGFADVLVAPSPKVQAYLIVSPWGSTVPALLNVHVVNDTQLEVNCGAGAVLPAGSLRVNALDVDAALPHPSVVVSVIVYVPAAA